jgi:hypothetical protein
MDRITHQSPRQQGYGPTSSLRNDSLKHTRKHKRSREESNQGTKLPGSGGLSGQVGRTVRKAYADSPARCRGHSARTTQTVRPEATDRPLNPTEPPEPTREKRTVREDQADRPLLKLGPSANWLQRKPKTKPDRTETNQEHEEHHDELHVPDRSPPAHGLSTPYGQNRKLPDLEGQPLQSITGSPKQ